MDKKKLIIIIAAAVLAACVIIFFVLRGTGKDKPDDESTIPVISDASDITDESGIELPAIEITPGNEDESKAITVETKSGDGELPALEINNDVTRSGNAATKAQSGANTNTSSSGKTDKPTTAAKSDKTITTDRSGTKTTTSSRYGDKTETTAKNNSSTSTTRPSFVSDYRTTGLEGIVKESSTQSNITRASEATGTTQSRVTEKTTDSNTGKVTDKYKNDTTKPSVTRQEGTVRVDENGNIYLPTAP